LSGLLRRIAARTLRGVAAAPVGRGYCAICERRILRFLPYAPDGLRAWRPPPLIQSLEVIGSDTRRFSCPVCLAHDRERHLLLFLRACGLLERLPALRVLHMAPEAGLARIIAAARPARYVKGDLFPQAADVQKMDLQALPFAAESFDLVIANHVLEHVADDVQAVAEIGRVLVPGGHAILQTPYSPLLMATLEDKGIATPQARLQAYGQEDHVRLHGRDVFRRFASAGLVDRSVTHQQVLRGVDSARHGVNPREPLFLFEKPQRLA
jgi:SAM-dependent methyltransferase